MNSAKKATDGMMSTSHNHRDSIALSILRRKVDLLVAISTAEFIDGCSFNKMTKKADLFKRGQQLLNHGFTRYAFTVGFSEVTAQSLWMLSQALAQV